MELLSIKEQKGAKHIGIYRYIKSKRFSRQPLRRLPDGRVISLLGMVVNINHFIKIK